MDAPIGSKAGRITQDAHKVGVEIDLSELSGRLEREAMRLITDLSQQGYSGKELADRVAAGLMNLSDAPVNDAARGAAAESFNLGRNLGAQEVVDQIATVVRTEVLDINTCPPCERLDYENSKIVYKMNSPEYFRDMPPNQCDGRELCRGFYIYLSEAALPGVSAPPTPIPPSPVAIERINEAIAELPRAADADYVKVPLPVGPPSIGGKIRDLMQYVKVDETLRTIPIKGLIATQSDLEIWKLRYLVENGIATGEGINPGHVVKYGGKLYILDGTHRTAIAKIMGEDSIRVIYTDLDALMPGGKP